MADRGTIAEHFEAQAQACERLGSPFTAGLCRAVIAALDESTETGRRVLGWDGDPNADALALRLCGGLHALVLNQRDPVLSAAFPPRAANAFILRALLPATFRNHDRALSRALDSPPQTNEVGRSAMLLPGLLLLSREWNLPLALHEIGSSAGLNLCLDRFHYQYGEQAWGDPQSAVQLAPELLAEPVPLEGDLRIVSRQGSDRAPVSLFVPEQVTRLRSFVWPDQTARLERLDAAVGIAQEERVRVRRAEATDAVRRMLSERKSGEGTVLMHSVVWQYLPEETRQAIVELMVEAGEGASADRPLAWLRMEPASAPAGTEPFAALTLTTWPGAKTRHLADCDFHGRWIAWK
ncbi:DUF2332 family protein [Mesorhizobium sp. RP14(2022)]|uniref:DUF2332 family protein n=1 Tax=Mesorhizobium liriopis TaxID=2953882 RepID=A0ABT1C8D9_9HYPH|nr:DUF2332 family protein [Mesorhizobium liriopis]MCO6051102.1 DUF2332 family protein [Mesorhizobium liriopis]